MSDFSSGLNGSLGTIVGNGAPTDTGSMGDLLPKTATQQKGPAGSRTKKAPKAAGDDKRRGPNSHRVREMFAAVGTDRIPLDELIKKHHVSVHVARQSKRFDPHSDRGQIVIKTLPNDATGEKCTYIWRVAK